MNIKNNKKVGYFLLITLMLLSSISITTEQQAAMLQVIKKENTILSITLKRAYNPGGYKIIGPVVINSNSELTDFIISHGFPGSGTANDPFIITQLFFSEIDPSLGTSLYISGITAYLVIENCSFSIVSGTAIELNSVSNIVIRQNYFDIYGEAIRVFAASKLEISGNQILRSEIGITVQNSMQLSITENTIQTISSSTNAISLMYVNETVFSQNTIKFHPVNIGYNNVLKKGKIGVYVFSSKTTNITNNLIENYSSGLDIRVTDKIITRNNQLIKSSWDVSSYSISSLINIDFSNNTIDGKQILFLQSRSNLEIDASEYSQVIIYNGDNITLKNLDIGDYDSTPLVISSSYLITIKDSVIGHNHNPLISVLSFSSSNVTLNNCIITGNNKGFYAYNGENITITNSILEGGITGIQFSSIEHYFNISDNIFRNSSNGIQIQSSSGGYIINNLFYNNKFESVRLSYTFLHTFKDNSFDRDPIRLLVPSIAPTTKLIETFQNNTVNGKEILWYENITDIIISNKDVSAIFLINVSNVKIIQSTISNGFYGIGVFHTTNVYIENVNLQSNFFGVIGIYNFNITCNNLYVVNTNYTAIYLYNIQNSTIKNTVMNNNDYGILLSSSTNVYIEDNYFYNSNESGIKSYLNSYIHIYRNKFQNIMFTDLYGSRTQNYYIKDNIMEKGIILDTGYTSQNYFTFNEFSNNTVNGKKIILILNQYATQIINNAAQVILVNASNVIVTNNQFEAVAYPIFTYNTSNTLIMENHFSNNYYSIYLSYSRGIILLNNEFNNVSKFSIWLEHGYNITIKQNNLLESTAFGIDIYLSEKVMIFENIIKSPQKSLTMVKSNNITIEENNISDSTDGIFVYLSSNVTAINNNLYNASFVFNLLSVSDFETIYLKNNKVNDYPVFYLLEEYNQVIENQKVGQIILVGSKNITITNVELNQTFYPFIAFNSSNIVISNIKISRVGIALQFQHINNATILNSTLSNVQNGAYFKDSENILLSNNMFENYTSYALVFDVTTNSLVTHNEFNNATLVNITSALDNGKNNVFLNNQWAKWVSPDDNNDNIVDSPYYLDGKDENYDLYPLAIKEITPTLSSEEQNSSSSVVPTLNNLLFLAIITIIVVIITVGVVIFYLKKKRKLVSPTSQEKLRS